MHKIKPVPTEVLRDSSHHGDNNFRFADKILNEASVPVSSTKKNRDNAGEAADQKVQHHRNFFNTINPFKWFGEIVSTISILTACMSMIGNC
jgi:hypothetical protein